MWSGSVQIWIKLHIRDYIVVAMRVAEHQCFFILIGSVDSCPVSLFRVTHALLDRDRPQAICGVAGRNVLAVCQIKSLRSTMPCTPAGQGQPRCLGLSLVG